MRGGRRKETAVSKPPFDKKSTEVRERFGDLAITPRQKAKQDCEIWEYLSITVTPFDALSNERGRSHALRRYVERTWSIRPLHDRWDQWPWKLQYGEGAGYEVRKTKVRKRRRSIRGAQAAHNRTRRSIYVPAVEASSLQPTSNSTGDHQLALIQDTY